MCITHDDMNKPAGCGHSTLPCSKNTTKRRVAVAPATTARTPTRWVQLSLSRLASMFTVCANFCETFASLLHGLELQGNSRTACFTMSPVYFMKASACLHGRQVWRPVNGVHIPKTPHTTGVHTNTNCPMHNAHSPVMASPSRCRQALKSTNR